MTTRGGPFSRLVLEAMHITITQAEMMPDLVNHDMPHQGRQVLATLDPFVEDRAAIEENPVGRAARVHRRFLPDRAAMIDAGQIARVVADERVERLVVGELLDAPADNAQLSRA